MRGCALVLLPVLVFGHAAAEERLPPVGAPAAWHAVIGEAGDMSLRVGWHLPIHLTPALFTTNWMAHEVAEPVAAGPQAADGVITAERGAAVASHLDWRQTTNGLHLAYHFTARASLAVNALHVGLDLPSARFAGGWFAADGERHPLPRESGETHLLVRTVRRLDLASPQDGVISLVFDAPTAVLVQDSRQWGPNFSVRAGALETRTWQPGETLDVAFTLTADRPLTVAAEAAGGPVTLTAGADWIPLVDRTVIEAGSALDFRNLRPTVAPAGGLGRVIATRGGHFAFAGAPDKPVRFYGVNLCFTAQYLPHATADRLAQHLACMGYNAVRLHHYDDGLIRKDAGITNAAALDPAALDQFDYLVSALKREGLYVTTDLFVSRTVPAAAIWPGAPGDVAMNEFKMAVPVNATAFANWQTFARALLTHRNPYIGLTWAEDPIVAWLSMINEDNAENDIGALSDRLKPDWQAAWNRWLARTYASRAAVERAWGADAGGDPVLGTVPWQPDLLSARDRRGSDFGAFVAETQRAMFDRMAAWLHGELDCRALLTDRNGWNNRLASHLARTGYDYVDDHFYVDHPEFLAQAWRLPSRCANTSPIADGHPGGLYSAFVRRLDKPFAITEFNYAAPGRFRGMGGILTGAIGALQDWDGIWRFAYSHDRANIEQPAPTGYFDIATDPLNAIAERASVCLFLRGDLRPAPHTVALQVPAAELAARTAPNLNAVPAWCALALVTRVGACLDAAGDKDATWLMVPAGADVTDRALGDRLVQRGWLPAASADFESGCSRSETGELALDAGADTMVLDTPATAGGCGPDGAIITAGPLRVQLRGAPATVWVSSLDGRPLTSSHRLLVAHLTDLQNSDARFAEAGRRTLLAWGHLPHLVRAGRAEIVLRNEASAALQAWALDMSGHRVGAVPVKAVNGAIRLDLDVQGPAGACLAYEIAAP